MNLKSKNFGYICAILSALCFGSVSTLAKPTLVSINPFVLTSMVYLLSAATLTPVTINIKDNFLKKDLLLIILVAIAGSVCAPLMFFHGLQLTSAANTAVISNVEIVFTVFIAIMFFKERLPKIGYAGIVMVSIGAMVVTSNFGDAKSFLSIDQGGLFVIGSSLFWAIDNNLSKIITKRVNVLKIAQLKSGIGGTLLLAITFIIGIPFVIPANEIPFLLLLGIVGFALSLFLFLKGLHLIGVVKTIVIFATSSIFGMIFAIVFLQEKISWYQIVAIGIMILGIYLINKQGKIEPGIAPP